MVVIKKRIISIGLDENGSIGEGEKRRNGVSGAHVSSPTGVWDKEGTNH